MSGKKGRKRRRPPAAAAVVLVGQLLSRGESFSYRCHHRHAGSAAAAAPSARAGQPRNQLVYSRGVNAGGSSQEAALDWGGSFVAAGRWSRPAAGRRSRGSAVGSALSMTAAARKTANATRGNAKRTPSSLPQVRILACRCGVGAPTRCPAPAVFSGRGRGVHVDMLCRCRPQEHQTGSRRLRRRHETSVRARCTFVSSISPSGTWYLGPKYLWL